MNRQTTLRLHAKHKPYLALQFGVTDKALRPELRPFTEQEAVQVFTTGIDRGQFVVDPMRFDATVRHIAKLSQ